MLEKRLKAVPAQSFTANGTTDGKITIAADPCGLFKVKQHVIISATSLPNITLEIKRIEAGNVYVGPIPDGKPGVNTSIDARYDISAYTVALGAAISANEQKRPAIDWAEAMRAMYEEEPTVAMRSVLVDKCGNKIDETNPLPVAATFDGDVHVGSVRITACDDDPVMGDIHSSIRIAGIDCNNELVVNPDGTINVNVVNSTPPTTPSLVVLHNEITGIASGAETTIISLVAPLTGYRIEKVEVTGDNTAIFRVKVNGTTIANRRSWWCDFNQEFDFEDFLNGLLLTSGQILTVTVVHNRPHIGAFEATVMYLNQ